MGRGKGMNKKNKTFRIDDEMWDELKKIGDGNATKGLEKVYNHYVTEAEGREIVQDDVVKTVRRELTTILDKSLHKHFINAVDFWIRNGYRPARIESFATVFGVSEGDTRKVGQIMKRLEGGGVMLHDFGGFRPIVQCNNGLSEEKFLEYFDKYSEIVKNVPDTGDLVSNILYGNSVTN